MHIIDISMEIHQGMVVYPGSPRPKIERYASIPQKRTNESIIELGSHTGTHLDAPLHVKRTGKSVTELPLESFFGECRVLDLTDVGKQIRREHLAEHKIKKYEIILLKTENSLKQLKTFRKDFAHLKRGAAEYLLERKIKTLGVDYLSVKKFGADHDVHEMLINNLSLFEGLFLKKVKPGRYLFVGLPLKVKCDGAPVRAILINK